MDEPILWSLNGMGPLEFLLECQVCRTALSEVLRNTGFYFLRRRVHPPLRDGGGNWALLERYALCSPQWRRVKVEPLGLSWAGSVTRGLHAGSFLKEHAFCTGKAFYLRGGNLLLFSAVGSNLVFLLTETETLVTWAHVGPASPASILGEPRISAGRCWLSTSGAGLVLVVSS